MEEAALMPMNGSMLGSCNRFPRRTRAPLLAFCCAIALLVWPGRTAGAAAQSQAPTIQLPGLTIRGDSTSITILVLLTLLTLLPAILLSMTPFVRILIIFHFLRQALGTQTAPTNQTLIGLALFLTYFIMQPVGVAGHTAAIVPFEQGKLNTLQALDLASAPVRRFMLSYAREKD